MLIFRDPDVNDLTLTDRLRTLFGLSRSEAAIAIDLSLGRSTGDILAKRGVRPSTLKTQLESLTGKMGCARQSEVAAMVASLPPITSS
jgi:DNA-binding CsgD family transcriptional regulator